MSYLKDYLFFNSGNECPKPFHQWAALSLLAAVLNRGVGLQRGGQFFVRPNIYVALVGTAGSGKSTAKDVAKAIFMTHFSGRMISASIQSREDILNKMGSNECIHAWTNPLTGKTEEFRPFYLMINELANFLSVDARKMIDTLVDIFDTDHITTGFKNAASSTIENPLVNMLACVQPEWFMSNLKHDLFSGGLGRRLIIVYEDKEIYIPNPFVPEGGKEAMERVIAHLKNVSKIVGTFKMTAEAEAWWNRWYLDITKRINKEDPILKQFHETKHIILLKVAQLLALTDYDLKFILELDHLMGAEKMLSNLEPRILRLTSGIGRNVLAGIAVQMGETLLQMGGLMTEKQMYSAFYRQADTEELKKMIEHLQSQEKIKVFDFSPAGGMSKRYISTPEKHVEIMKQIEAAKKANATAST